MTWTHQPGDSYHITGTDVRGRRLKKIITTNPRYALALNLYRGSVWLVRAGKRRLVKRVYN